MRQFLLLLLALSSVCGVPIALAQSTAALPSTLGSPERTAVINFNAAVLKTKEAQNSLADLQKKLAPREAHLKALSDEVDSLKKQLDASGDKLSDQERATRLRTLDSKNKQLQREAEDYRNDSQAESQQAFQEVAQKVYAFLQDYAKRHGYTYVIERGSAESPIIWYASGDVDITEQVADAYNAQAPAALPATPHPAPR